MASTFASRTPFRIRPGRNPHRRPGGWVGLLVGSGALVILAGCGDLDPIPPAELQDGEPLATMQFSEGLPSLPELARRWVPDRSLDPIVDRWREGWNHPEEAGQRIRLEATRAATPFLTDRMTEGDVERTLAGVTRAIEAVDEALMGGTPEGIDGPLSRARFQHDEARRALDAGAVEEALTGALLSADHLRATTPDAVARALLVQADEALRRISRDETYPEVTRQRGERLVIGARDALEGGEPTLALRRAWYAVGLLQNGGDGSVASPPDPEPETPGS